MDFKVEIENDVALPEKQERDGIWSAHLKGMEKGQSFFVPDASKYAGLSGSCQNATKATDLRFRVLKRTEKRVQLDAEGNPVQENGKQVIRDVKGVRVYCLGKTAQAIADKSYTPRKITAKPKK